MLVVGLFAGFADEPDDAHRTMMPDNPADRESRL
jgi:hypothetical protein